MPACSRCGCATPNSSCIVCAVQEPEERDAFEARDEHEWQEEQRKDEP